MAVTVDEMKPQLYTLDQVRDVLARTEPLSTRPFSVGDQVRFVVDPSWHHGIDATAGTEPVNAYLVLGGGLATHEHQLTKDALLEATSIIGLRRDYAARCPGVLLEDQLNYWFREGLTIRRAANRDFQLLVAAGLGAAITRQSIVPFSNLRLVDQAIIGIENRYGKGEILADYKLTHSLRKTYVRLIVPAAQRTMINTGTPDDTWSVGIQLRNSLIGEERTELSGYLFRWICTNGQVDTQATSGAWRRQGSGREAEVYEWARNAVDDVLGGLEPALDAVQATTAIPVEGNASDVLRNVFKHYGTPLAERAKIINNMVDAGGDLTMYTVMAAITQVANQAGMEPGQVDNLLRMGGDLPHAVHCQSCRQLLPH